MNTVKRLAFKHNGEIYELETFMTEAELNGYRASQAALPMTAGALTIDGPLFTISDDEHLDIQRDIALARAQEVVDHALFELDCVASAIEDAPIELLRPTEATIEEAIQTIQRALSRLDTEEQTR